MRDEGLVTKELSVRGASVENVPVKCSDRLSVEGDSV